MTSAERNLLEGEYQKGVTNGQQEGAGNRKRAARGLLMVPSTGSEQLVKVDYRRKQLQQAYVDQTSRFELRQSRATTLAKEHFDLVKDSQEVICFAKYRDVLLRKVTRITSVDFDETQKKMDCPRCPCSSNTTAESTK
jgi:hypothetical protein